MYFVLSNVMWPVEQLVWLIRIINHQEVMVNDLIMRSDYCKTAVWQKYWPLNNNKNVLEGEKSCDVICYNIKFSLFFSLLHCLLTDGWSYCCCLSLCVIDLNNCPNLFIIRQLSSLITYSNLTTSSHIDVIGVSPFGFCNIGSKDGCHLTAISQTTTFLQYNDSNLQYSTISTLSNISIT